MAKIHGTQNDDPRKIGTVALETQDDVTKATISSVGMIMATYIA